MSNHIQSLDSNNNLKYTNEKLNNKLTSFSIDFSALDNLNNNYKNNKYDKISKIRIKDYLNEKQNTSPFSDKKLNTLTTSSSIEKLNIRNPLSINKFREQRYVKDSDTKVVKENPQSKSWNLSSINTKIKAPIRTMTKPLIDFNPNDHVYQKIHIESLMSPGRYIFRCKICDKFNNDNNSTQQYSCNKHLNCNTNLCKRCWDALFLLNNKDEFLSSKDLFIEDVNNKSINKKPKNEFFDKDDEIKKLNAKIKILEKSNKEQKIEIDQLNFKLNNYDQMKLVNFNSCLQELFNNFKSNQKFKNSSKLE